MEVSGGDDDLPVTIIAKSAEDRVLIASALIAVASGVDVMVFAKAAGGVVATVARAGSPSDRLASRDTNGVADAKRSASNGSPKGASSSTPHGKSAVMGACCRTVGISALALHLRLCWGTCCSPRALGRRTEDPNAQWCGYHPKQSW